MIMVAQALLDRNPNQPNPMCVLPSMAIYAGAGRIIELFARCCALQRRSKP